MKKRLLLIVVLLLKGMSSLEAETNVMKWKPYGFVRNFFCYDSRKSLRSSGEMFNMIPLDRDLNKYGDDLNQTGDVSFLAITSRLGINVSGMQFMNADLSGKIEADFNGFSGSTTMLRLRQAFMQLKWQHSRVVIGQTWHPITEYVTPDVFSLASGSPFNPFSRSPQVRYDYEWKRFICTAAALYQFQYTSPGPEGYSAEYAKNAIVPELFFSTAYSHQDITLGFGVDYLELRPRTTSLDNQNVKVKVSDRVRSISPIVFANYTSGLFSLKSKLTYANNTGQLFMMSGYGVTGQHPDGSYDYAPLRSYVVCGTASYGKKIRTTLFGGYMKNRGMSKSLLSEDLLYVRGYKNIDRMWRWAPSVSYNLPYLNLGFEYESTSVAYGDKIEVNATVSQTHTVTNHRLCFMVKYSF